MSQQRLDDLLANNAHRLVAFVRQHAQTLLMYESVEDLVQGATVRVIEQHDRFEERSEPESRAWLYAIVRGHLADRHAYWGALKRRSGRVLRLTMSPRAGDGSSSSSSVPMPTGSTTGPGTFAERRELLALATRALAALPDRDRQLVQWTSQQVAIEDQAERLDVTYAAAQKAGLRAQERFRKTFTLLLRR